MTKRQITDLKNITFEPFDNYGKVIPGMSWHKISYNKEKGGQGTYVLKMNPNSKSLPCGTVSINTFSEGDIKTPFGGYKQSGSLNRDQGTEALNQYLQTKTIWISHS